MIIESLNQYFPYFQVKIISTMMDLETIQHELKSADFVLKTQRQIIKDFGTAGIDFPEDFSSLPFPIDQLLTSISIHLKELNSTSASAFSQLLYQIDIPESLLADLSLSDDFYSGLAEVVLRREAYKVFLRGKFS